VWWRGREEGGRVKVCARATESEEGEMRQLMWAVDL
jgi:hypothetical protein